MGDWQRKSDAELASDSSTGGNGQIAAIEMLRRVLVGFAWVQMIDMPELKAMLRSVIGPVR